MPLASSRVGAEIAWDSAMRARSSPVSVIVLHSAKAHV